MIHTRLRPILVWGVLLLLYLLYDEFMSQNSKGLVIKLLPGSIFKLDRDFMLALAATCTASFLAWMVAIFGGLLLGTLVAASAVDRDRHSWISLGSNVNMVVQASYIIPFVLTVGLFYALVSQGVTEHRYPRWSVTGLLLVVAGMTLGGYQIYRSVYESVVKAKDDSRILVSSLYFRKEYGRVWKFFRPFVRVSRLHDCEIQGFWAAIELAAHLSIVSVMIVETVVPSFYEFIFPSTGAAPRWVGGAGRLILSAQSLYKFEQIAGCIWMVLTFDFFLTTASDLFAGRRWYKYYGV